MTSRVLLSLVLVSVLATAGCGGSGGCDCPPVFSSSFLLDARPATLSLFNIQQTSTPSAGGSTTFVTGPLTPPLGTGSVQFTIGTDGNGAEELRFPTFNGTRLDELTALSYATFIQTSQRAYFANSRSAWLVRRRPSSPRGIAKRT